MDLSLIFFYPEMLVIFTRGTSALHLNESTFGNCCLSCMGWVQTSLDSKNKTNCEKIRFFSFKCKAGVPLSCQPLACLPGFSWSTFSIGLCPPDQIDQAFMIYEDEIENMGSPSVEAFAHQYLQYIKALLLPKPNVSNQLQIRLKSFSCSCQKFPSNEFICLIVSLLLKAKQHEF